jgi:pimeloyl-ACP methyl ester carboxylesterase
LGWRQHAAASACATERIQLADEAALVAPLLATLAAPVFLVGHSYGAAVALKAVLANPVVNQAIASFLDSYAFGTS